MGESPYRAMSLPPAPRQAWRAIVDRSLAALNMTALALIPLLALRETGRTMVVPDAGFVPIPLAVVLVEYAPFAVASGLALLGFLGRGDRRVRAGLLLPSGVLWLLAGLIQLLLALLARDVTYGPTRAPTPAGNAMMFMLGCLLFIGGVLTIQSAVARMLGPSRDTASTSAPPRAGSG